MLIIPMKKIGVKSELLIVLRDMTTKQFTVDALTEQYLSHPSSLHSSKKAARQFVYRNMQRLMKAGQMERLPTDGRWPQYRLSDKFRQKEIPSPVSVTSTVSEATAPAADPMQPLRDRLNRHKLEMLSAMGEVEEYDELCKEMPELRDTVQARYNESRDKCSKLLGRVKALESLLAAC
jgi:hypothetical protein